MRDGGRRAPRAQTTGRMHTVCLLLQSLRVGPAHPDVVACVWEVVGGAGSCMHALGVLWCVKRDGPPSAGASLTRAVPQKIWALCQTIL